MFCMRFVKAFYKLPGLLAPSLLIWTGVAAQPSTKDLNPSCRIGAVTFHCPEGFTKISNIDTETSLFKYQKNGTILYFFVSIPLKALDYSKITNAIAEHYLVNKQRPFRWKKARQTFMMSMKTKYDKQLASWLGYDGTRLITLTTSRFKVNRRNVILGYAWENDRLVNAEERFESASGTGDHAVGCNAIVNTLNSITKEFLEEQYCFLTGFSFSGKK